MFSACVWFFFIRAKVKYEPYWPAIVSIGGISNVDSLKHELKNGEFVFISSDS